MRYEIEVRRYFMRDATWAGVQLSASCFGAVGVVFLWTVGCGCEGWDEIRWDTMGCAVGYGCAILVRSTTEQST